MMVIVMERVMLDSRDPSPNPNPNPNNSKCIVSGGVECDGDELS
jgi:hypothetical protein